MTQDSTAETLMQSRQGLAWLHTHRALLIALGASFVLHVVATIGTWFEVWRPTEVAPFTAMLSPLSIQETIASDLSTLPPPRRVPTSTVRKRAPRPIATPKSEATFAAPENAIAVERTDSENEALLGATAADVIGKVADSTDSPAAIPVVPVTPEMPPVVAEKVAVSAAPERIAEAIPPMELPTRVSIAYKATTSVADGVAHYTWKRDGEKYTFESTIQASGFFVDMFAGTLTQHSSGTVTAAGIEPALFTIRRGDRGVETAEFQRATGLVKLSRGSDSRKLPMPPNLQDTQSFLFQLAFEAARLKTTEDRLSILVTNARGVNRYTFRKVGDVTLETNRGPVETVHLVREATELRDSYEAWLSPKHHYLPMKLKFFVDRFPAELIATNITSTP